MGGVVTYLGLMGIIVVVFDSLNWGEESKEYWRGQVYKGAGSIILILIGVGLQHYGL